MRRGIMLAGALVLVAVRPVVALDLVEAWRAAASGDVEYEAAQAAGQAGQARRAQGEALWRPAISVSATAGVGSSETATSGARFSAPGFGQSQGVAFDTSINHGALGRIAITARQPLLSGERQAQRRQLDLAADAAQFELKAAGQARALRVAQAYFELVLAVGTDRVLRRQQRALQRALEQVRERFTLGDVPVTDTHEAAARAQGVNAQVLAAGTEIELKRAALADLTGMPAARLQPDAPAGLVRFAALPGLEQALEAAADGNPQLRAAAVGLESARQEVNKLSSVAATSVDLVAQYGRERLAGSGDFGSATSAAASGLIGIQINVPLYTGGYRGAREEELARLADRSAAELKRLRQQVALQTRAAWLGLAVGSSRQDALAEALNAGNARLDATRVGQQVGDRTTLDLLNAESDAAAAELALQRVRVDLLLDRLRLAALAGQLDEALLLAVNAHLGQGGAR
jgi:outer membrane protein